MTINPSIFRAYDIRAPYPSELNEEAAGAIAKAFAFFTNADKVVIGRDAKESSASIHKAMIDALVNVGVHVYDMGEVPTPLIMYAVAKKGFIGGIVVTASHTSSTDAGIKLIKHPNFQLSIPGELEDVKKLSMNPAIADEVKETKGKTEQFSILDEYVEELTEKFVEVKDLKVVVDYGNGMGSISAKPVFDKLDIEVIPMYEKIDMSFPNHVANPMDESTLDDIRKKVVEEKADLGVAFDGDADRTFCIDENGEIVYPDIITAILVPNELKGRSDKRVYYDIRMSRVVQEVIKENNGEGIMTRGGNPFYKSQLTEQGGVFGAEVTGHVFFQDHYNIDDGLYFALKAMKAFVYSKKKLSELANPLKKYFASPELRLKTSDADKALDKVKQAFSDGRLVEIDGVRVDYPDWWFILRKSNTEPVIKLRLEATSKEKLDEMQKKLVGMIKE
ncbi:phosphomannomutase/phosphoglucomutase [Candidatus Woesearchaeota archaeon]|nr:phosphomannomutase/phosphoglucomutase [Candidatus Woesearchaeota archaeon]